MTLRNGHRSDRRIHVGHCAHALGIGGAQQVMRYVAKSGDAAAFEHFVYTGKGGVMVDVIRDAGATVHVIKRKLPRLDPIWIARLRHAMVRDAIDVVHCHMFGDSLHGYLAARTLGNLPVLLTIHSSSVENYTGLQRVGYRWLIQRADRTVGCSEASARQFREYVPTAGDRIEVIPNGLDLRAVPELDDAEWAAFRSEVGIPPDSRVVGAVGRMVPSKGFAYLIDAFAHLIRTTGTTARLVIIGDGPLRQELQEHVDGLERGEQILLAGYRAEAAKLTSRLDALVFASDYEGLSLSMLEGMASRRCLVATNVDGIREVVTDDHDAILVPPRDVEAMSAALHRAIGDRQLRERLGEAAYQTVASRYTAERMTASYEGLYRRLIADKRGSQAALAGAS